MASDNAHGSRLTVTPRERWPLVLAAAALLLGAAGSQAVTGDTDWLAGGLLALGSACVGAWIRGDDR